MDATSSKCARCGGDEQAGAAVIHLDGTTTPLYWIAGLASSRGALGVAMGDRERLPMSAHRCASCGAVRFEAQT